MIHGQTPETSTDRAFVVGKLKHQQNWLFFWFPGFRASTFVAIQLIDPRKPIPLRMWFFVVTATLMVKRINYSFLTGKFLFIQTGNMQLKATGCLRFTCWVLPTCGHHTKNCWPHGHTNSEPQGGLLVPPVLRHSRRKIIWLGTFLREMFWRMSMKSN